MPQQGLKIHALPQGDALRRRADGAETDEVDGLGGGVQQPLPPDQCPGEDAGEDIPGAEKLPVHPLRLDGAAGVLSGVVAHGAGLPLREGDAGEGHGAPAKAAQFFRQGLQARLVPGQGLIGHAQQEGGLRQVGGDDVGLRREVRHPAAHGGGVGGVDPAEVPHHGVHHGEGPGAAEVPEELADEVDLPLAAEKAAVDGVEPEVQGLPVGGGGGHLLRQVPEGVALKAPGVGGEDGRGQGAALDPHGGEHGDGHRQRAAAEAGEIVDGGDAGRRHGGGLPSGPPERRIFRKKELYQLFPYCSRTSVMV